MNLSARADHRVLTLARTIADLAGSERIQPAHLAEAIHLRSAEKMMEWVDSQTTRIGTRFGRRLFGSECKGIRDGQARRRDSPPAYRSAVTLDHRWGAVSGACSAVTSFTTLCHAAAKVTGC